MQTLTLSSVETTFTYNSDGLRTNKTTGDVSHDYIWSGDTLLAEVTDDYILRFIHDEAGNIIGFEHHLAEVDENGEIVYVLDATYYYEKNIFGDVVGIYDENGTKVASYAYNAYGQCHVLDNYTDAAIGSSVTEAITTTPTLISTILTADIMILRRVDSSMPTDLFPLDRDFSVTICMHIVIIIRLMKLILTENLRLPLC